MTNISEALATSEFFHTINLPCCIVNRDKGIYLANQALAKIFGYDSIQDINQSLLGGYFFSEHFTANTLDHLQKILATDGQLQSWPICAQTLDDRELDLKITAQASWSDSRSTPQQLMAFFVQSGADDSTELFKIKALAQAEAHLAQQAKDEFLANISHELRTPLNIILGMLSLAMEDESIDPRLCADLALAHNAADGLFNILNDLITLSFLAARRLTPDIIPFCLSSMLVSMQHRFATQAQAKEVTITIQADSPENIFLEGGYNFIVQALEKIISNAIKVSETRGQVDLEAKILENADGGVWLQCSVSDSGPGLDDNIIQEQTLFCQGDGSINRKHGGLGLGLNLATNLAKSLGGKLILSNRPEGGAKILLEVPAKIIILEDER